MQIDDVLEWARDGKWAILETHPETIKEAIEQLADLRASVKKLKYKHENTRIINWEKYCEDCDTYLSE